MKSILHLIAILTCGDALASLKEVNRFDITISGWTEHLTSNGRNQDNNIIGFRFKKLELFTLINSFDKRAYGVGYYPQWTYNDHINYGVRIGGMTGYSIEENSLQHLGITPFVAPAITFHYKSLGAEVAMFNDVMVFSVKIVIDR
ncbi:hypothetical protein ACPV5O_18400 [Vibrio maritimus]|uniref:hypothetical protein n=1 Tax=Vibrio maritimus TaxID=990268 RepID=UPI00406855F5